MACDSRGPLALRAAPDRAAPHAVVGERVVLSWSGGKDCCLALHRAIASGAVPGALLTVFTEDGTRSRSHGLARSVLEAQAAALGVELRTTAASWQDYRAKLVQLLAAAQRDGARAAVFGDIDIDAHRDWELAVARDAGLTGLLPLWGASRRELLDEWWRLGFEARIIVVREGVLSREYLGRVLDAKLARELEALGVDACGENGEFHTLATDGPLFRHPLEVVAGEPVKRADCWVEDLRVRW